MKLMVTLFFLTVVVFYVGSIIEIHNAQEGDKKRQSIVGSLPHSVDKLILPPGAKMTIYSKESEVYCIEFKETTYLTLEDTCQN